MSRLYATLRPFYRPSNALGGDHVIDRPALREALLGLATDLRRLFWARAVMICVVFIIEVVVGAVYLESPAVLVGIVGAFGLTVAGGIKGMEAVSRDMAEVNLLVLLAGELDVESLGHIVDALVTKLAGSRSPRRGIGLQPRSPSRSQTAA